METQIFSSGYLAGKLQRCVRDIEALLDRAGYRPIMVINDVPHWGVDALVWLRGELQRFPGN